MINHVLHHFSGILARKWVDTSQNRPFPVPRDAVKRAQALVPSLVPDITGSNLNSHRISSSCSDRSFLILNSKNKVFFWIPKTPSHSFSFYHRACSSMYARLPGWQLPGWPCLPFITRYFTNRMTIQPILSQIQRSFKTIRTKVWLDFSGPLMTH